MINFIIINDYFIGIQLLKLYLNINNLNKIIFEQIILSWLPFFSSTALLIMT